jgi:hypothetical protein
LAHYETTDLFKGAFLLCKGGDLFDVTFNNRQIATFIISGDSIHQLDRDYMTGKALVNPVIFRQSLNHLRDVLFEIRDRRKTNGSRTNTNRRHQARR